MQAAHQIDLDPSGLDYSMFTHRDLVNIVLQRSEVLSDIKSPGAVIRAWIAGDEAPLDDIVSTKGAVLAQRAARVIGQEFAQILLRLRYIAPSSIADIGCGYAFFGLYAYHALDCDLLLIDVEQNEHRHFGFEEEAAAYSNLTHARDFLIANGVPADRVRTWNPEEQDLDEARKVRLAVSFLACGFHFPVDMYMPFFRFGVEPGGKVMLDLRGKQFQENKRILQKLGRVEVLTQGGGRKRVLVHKGQTG